MENEVGKIPRPGSVSKFSDLVVISLSMTTEAMVVDSDNLLFLNIKNRLLERFLKYYLSSDDDIT